jgi:chromosome partitioning protein
MAYVIAFCGQKGGSGKTTLSVSVAAELQRRGVNTLLVDADPQGSASQWIEIGREQKRERPDGQHWQRVVQLHRELVDARRQYDAIVVDTPPRMNEVQAEVLSQCDLALIPVSHEVTEQMELSSSVDIARAAQRSRNERGLEPLDVMVLITRLDDRVRGARALQSDVRSQLHVPVADAVLRRRADYGHAFARGQGVTVCRPGSIAALEVWRLMSDIEALAGPRLRLPAASGDTQRAQAVSAGAR